MPDEDSEPDPLEFPIPFGIQAETGQPLPGLDATTPNAPLNDDVLVLGQQQGEEAFELYGLDGNNLAEMGWCVLFAQGADPRVQEALEPLLDHRKAETGALYAVFADATGVLPGDTARKWLARQTVGFATVQPDLGVPAYVLLVGSPEEISFEFQYTLSLYWNVGRLHFDTPDEYRRYAENVVAYETHALVNQQKRAVIYSVANPGDKATALLYNQVTDPLLNGNTKLRMKPLQGQGGFSVEGIVGEAATKDRLASVLSGREPGGVPAFLFTGSHGVSFNMADATQREKQGALLCQDWPGFGAVTPDQMFQAADVPAGARLDGLIHFFFACYGGGCPVVDTFDRSPAPRQLVPHPIVARLPQRLLLAGALGTIAHIDRAWAYSFQNGNGAPLIQDFRDIMNRILGGQRLGPTMRNFYQRWPVLEATDATDPGLTAAAGTPPVPNPVQLIISKNRMVARLDARNYALLGDPAVRLRVDELTAFVPPPPALAPGAA